LNAGAKLRVIGRAGVGVDNSMLRRRRAAASLCSTAPGENTLSICRTCVFVVALGSAKDSAADANIRGEEMGQKDFEGVELYNKTLGV